MIKIEFNSTGNPCKCKSCDREMRHGVNINIGILELYLCEDCAVAMSNLVPSVFFDNDSRMYVFDEKWRAER